MLQREVGIYEREAKVGVGTTLRMVVGRVVGTEGIIRGQSVIEQSCAHFSWTKM